jgi:PKD repeat protein
MNQYYQTQKNHEQQSLVAQCEVDYSLHKKRKMLQKSKLFFAFLVSLFTFNTMQAQVATYQIKQNQLINCGTSCGASSFYNGCVGGSNPGFRWTDTLSAGAIIDSVVVAFNLGVECMQRAQAPTNLNNVAASTVSTNGWCACAQQEYALISRPQPSSYRKGQANEFYLVEGGSCVGFSESFQNGIVGNSNYARVYVYFKTADIEVVNVKPATNFTSMCRQSEYEIDLTLKNNGPGPGGVIDVQVEFEGADIVLAKVNISNLAVGQTRTYRISEIIIPSKLGVGLPMKATVLTPDLDISNNELTVLWDVLSTPYGAEFIPTADFPGFPRDGNRFNQDFITYNKTYRYNISAPSLYSNNRFNLDWTADFTALLDGAPMPASKFTYTGPSGSNNASVVFNLLEDDLNKEVQFRFNVTDLSGNGCDSTTVRYAVVMPTPKPEYDGFSVCEVDELQFVNKSTIASGLLSYRWDFGDGTGSTLFEPKKKFATLGSYPVKLVARSNIGFADSITVNVVVNPSPIVDFTFTNQCGNLPVNFTNLSSIGSGNISYFWEFGDGQTSEDVNANVIYNTPGQYSVTLTAESEAGCINSVSRTSFSYPAPIADFNVPTTICGGTELTFNNATSIAFSNWGNEWSFGEGTARSFDKNPSFLYKEFGDKQVKMKVTTQFGCVDSIVKTITVNPGPAIQITHSDVCSQTPVRFASNVFVPEGMTANYVWNIDGQILGAANPVVNFPTVGNKNVSVQITYANGCTNSASTVVKTGYKPSASFSTPDVVCAGQPISLANNTTIAFGTPKHTWHMGDGTVYSGVLSPNHTYANTEATQYTITLVSSASNDACPDTASMDVRVGVVPSCEFAVNETYVPGHRGFTFEPTQSDAMHTWYFGDGRTSNATNPTYQYQRDGKFTVKLVVRTPEGCMCESTQSVAVANLNLNDVLAQSGVEVYPNPSNGNFFIANPASVEIAQIKVLNTVGAVIASVVPSQVLTQYEMNLNGIAHGVYLVQIQAANGSTTVQRIIVAD